MSANTMQIQTKMSTLEDEKVTLKGWSHEIDQASVEKPGLFYEFF